MNQRHHVRRRRLFAKIGSAVAIVCLQWAPAASAGTFTWNAPNSGDWDVGTNWQGGTAPDGTNDTDILQFGGSANYVSNVTMPDPFVLNRLVFLSTAGTPEITGVALSFAGTAPSILQNGAGPFKLSAPISADVDLAFGGSGAGRVFLNGVIGGAGAMVFNAGTWQIGNVANTWTGGTRINAGATVELLPSDPAPQSVVFNDTAAPGGLLGAAGGSITMNGGTLKLTPTGTGSITFNGQAVSFGANGGTVVMVNDDPAVTGATHGGHIGGGEIALTTTAGATSPAVFRFNGGHLHQSSTTIASQYDWSTGGNVLRFNSIANNGPVRVELLDGAMHRLGTGGGGTQTITAPYTVRGTPGGDPGSGPAGTINVGNQRFGGTARLAVESASVFQLDGGLFLENAVQIGVTGAPRALNANVTVRGTASGNPGNVSFSGRSTGTALGPALNAPGTNAAGHNVLYLGSDGAATPTLNAKTLTVESGAIANLDLRVRADQANHHGVAVDALTVINPGGTVRLKQSLSNFTPPGNDPVSGAANAAINTANVGNIIFRGNIRGEGTTANESTLDIHLPGAVDLAAAQPHGGAEFQAATNLIVNGSGIGGLRVNGLARPNALFSGGGNDPVTNDVKVANLLTASRLAALTGTGGYLSPAPAGATFTVPANSDWAASVPVGLKVGNSNTGGADVALSGTFTHNVFVDFGATLNAAGATLGPATATANLGRVGGDGSIAGPLTLNTGGTVAPGSSAGTLIVTGGLTLLGTYQAEVTGPLAGQTDVLSITGGLTLGAGSKLDVSGGIFNGTSTYTIATYDTRAGQFGTVIGLPGTYEVNYGTGTNSAITLTPVPEPGAAAAGLVVGGLYLLRRPRRAARRD
jgi:fibronectin-binding autotransporter adhesin